MTGHIFSLSLSTLLSPISLHPSLYSLLLLSHNSSFGAVQCRALCVRDAFTIYIYIYIYIYIDVCTFLATTPRAPIYNIDVCKSWLRHYSVCSVYFQVQPHAVSGHRPVHNHGNARGRTDRAPWLLPGQGTVVRRPCRSFRDRPLRWLLLLRFSVVVVVVDSFPICVTAYGIQGARCVVLATCSYAVPAIRLYDQMSCPGHGPHGVVRARPHRRGWCRLRQVL